MGFIESNLMRGERVAYKTQRHWMVFRGSILLAILAFGVISVLALASPDPRPLILAALVIVGIILIPAFMDYSTSEFGVTNKRIIIKSGFIRRNSQEILLQKVEAITVTQTILGRFLDYGTIIITGTGGTKETFHNIASPIEFRRQVHQQI
jgi:uncharacterized membrane protein YdbT with pleckstrin-like domain